MMWLSYADGLVSVTERKIIGTNASALVSRLAELGFTRCSSNISLHNSLVFERRTQYI